MAQKEPIRNFVLHDRHGHEIDFSSFSVVSDVSVTLHAGVGEPYCESRYQGGILYLDFYNIKGEAISNITYDASEEDGGTNYLHITIDGGNEYTFPVKNGSRGNGITSIDTAESQEDDDYNVVRIHCTDDESEDGTEFRIKNGSRGNGIKSVNKIESSAADGGTNTWRITFDNDQTFDLSVLNGQKGSPGTDYQPVGDMTGLLIAQSLGQDSTKVISQKAVSDAVYDVFDSTIGSASAIVRPTLANNAGYVKYADGTIGGTSNGFHSDAISVQAGSLVVFYGYASGAIAPIAKYDGESYTPLVMGSGSSSNNMVHYYLMANEDMHVVFSGFSSKHANSWARIVNIGPSTMRYILDHASSKEDMQSALAKIAQIYEGTITMLTLTKTEGSYVKSDGSIGSFSGGFITAPVQIAAGTRLKVNICAGGSFAAIAKYDGESYTPLVLGKGQTQGVVELEYTATEDMQIVLSGYTNNWSQTSATAIILQGGILKDVIDFIDLDNPNSGINKAIGDVFSYEETKLTLDKNDGYVTPAGSLVGGTVGFYTSPIQVHAGDTIEFYGSGTSNYFAVISKYDNEEYVPLALGKTDALEMASYVIRIDEDMQVVFSGYANKFSESWAKVTGNYGGNVVKFTEELVQEKIDEAVGNKGDFNPICAFNNIVAVGDSLTYCQVYTSSSTSRKAYHPWPEQVMKKCGLDAQLTFAAPGEDSIEIWRHYKGVTEGYNGPIRVPENGKTLAIIHLGTNGAVVDETLDTDAPAEDVDTYESSWANTYTGCYCKIIQRLLNAGAKVVLVQPRAGGTGSQPDKAPEGWTLEDTRRSIITIANRFDCAYIDAEKCHSYDNLYHLYPSGSGKNTLHFNDFGYTYFAERIIEEISHLPQNLLKRIMPD